LKRKKLIQALEAQGCELLGQIFKQLEVVLRMSDLEEWRYKNIR